MSEQIADFSYQTHMLITLSPLITLITLLLKVMRRKGPTAGRLRLHMSVWNRFLHRLRRHVGEHEETAVINVISVINLKCRHQP